MYFSTVLRNWLSAPVATMLPPGGQIRFYVLLKFVWIKSFIVVLTYDVNAATVSNSAGADSGAGEGRFLKHTTYRKKEPVPLSRRWSPGRRRTHPRWAPGEGNVWDLTSDLTSEKPPSRKACPATVASAAL